MEEYVQEGVGECLEIIKGGSSVDEANRRTLIIVSSTHLNMLVLLPFTSNPGTGRGKMLGQSLRTSQQVDLDKLMRSMFSERPCF